MARTPRNTSATGIASVSSTAAPAGKRSAGYLVTIKGFVPVNRDSFAEQRAALDAMEAATKGDPAAALVLMTGVSVSQKFTTRVVETPPAASDA